MVYVYGATSSSSIFVNFEQSTFKGNAASSTSASVRDVTQHSILQGLLRLSVTGAEL